MQIFECKVPIPDVGFNANVYLIKLENQECILVDAGPNALQAPDMFEATLKTAEVSWGNIKHILVTHGHYDHYSFAAQIVERSGAIVWVHPADRHKLTITSENPFFVDQEAVIPFLKKHGVQKTKIGSLIDEVITVARGYNSLAESCIRSLSKETVLKFPGLTIQVIHTPGHTPGSCCFHLIEHDVVFTGDTLMPKITPNPIFDIYGEEKDQSLVRLQESMIKIRRLRASKAYPGHGDPILSIDPAIDHHFTRMVKRSDQVLETLGAHGLNTFSIANVLFPSGGRYHTWLALSETLGYLGWLMIQKRVRIRDDAGIVYWEAL